jgi:hypothetical protein
MAKPLTEVLEGIKTDLNRTLAKAEQFGFRESELNDLRESLKHLDAAIEGHKRAIAEFNKRAPDVQI